MALISSSQREQKEIFLHNIAILCISVLILKVYKLKTFCGFSFILVICEIECLCTRLSSKCVTDIVIQSSSWSCTIGSDAMLILQISKLRHIEFEELWFREDA